MDLRLLAFALPLLAACAPQEAYDPLEDYEQVAAATILDAPDAGADGLSGEQRRIIDRGRYLVELLGCGSCHTDGALIGEPRADRALAGSQVGVAYTNPLEYEYPGVVFAPNLTPDDETGIGRWNEQDLIDAIRIGEGRHGNRRILVMPWQGYARIRYDDAFAIARYLRSLTPVSHQVPAEVLPGRRTRSAYVHFGVYRSK